MKYGVHSSHICQQCLRRTNIGGCFLSFYMLFPGLQSHAQCAVILCINTNANDAARHVSFEIIFGRKERCVGTAIAKWYTKTLGGTDSCICTQFTGGSQ